MKLPYLIVLLCCIVFQSIAKYKVAIFDYDDRLTQQNTVAKHLEKKLLELDKTMVVKQFSGKENDRDAITTLKSIDSQGFDLIITITSDALVTARNIVKQTPLLFTNTNNPLFLGIESLDKPGRNMSGASYYVPVDKQLDLFMEIQPTMKKVGCIFDANNISRQVEASETRKAFKQKGLILVPKILKSADELTEATRELLNEGVDAILLTTSGLCYNNVDKVKAVSTPAKVPIYSYHKKAVPKGAIASLSSDYYLMIDKLIIPMAKEVLQQKKSPGDMAVRFLDQNIITINASEGKKVGLSIPETILNKAEKTH